MPADLFDFLVKMAFVTLDEAWTMIVQHLPA